MIRPLHKDDAFLEDVRSKVPDGAELRVWWLGQSGFLIQWNGHHLLLDPYLSDSLTRKYGQTDKPHVRMTEQVIDPARLNFIEAVTSSHNHTDHLDGETLTPLMRANPSLRIVVAEANREFAADRLQVEPDHLLGLAVGRAIDIGPWNLEAVPAAHEDLETDAMGHHRYVGYFVRVGKWTLYHSGDTVQYPGMSQALASGRIDLAMLPINGSRPERRVAGNMWGREAAQLARDIKAGCVIPCHYEMFEFNTESPDEFIQTCRELGQPFKVLRAGESWAI